MKSAKVGPSNRRARRREGDKGARLGAAKDAYVVAYGMANKYGSGSPEFDHAFSAFVAALEALSDHQADVFDDWQRTHVIAADVTSGRLMAMDPRAVGHDPDQVVDPEVLRWFEEVDAGARVPKVLASVPLTSIRSNPFVLKFDDGSIGRLADSLRSGRVDSWLVVAELPDGNYVDVDTPHICEALKRAGTQAAKVSVLGAFDGESCSRIGLFPWAQGKV